MNTDCDLRALKVIDGIAKCIVTEPAAVRVICDGDFFKLQVSISDRSLFTESEGRTLKSLTTVLRAVSRNRELTLVLV